MPKTPKWNEVRCPKCREPMSPSASRCPHCKADFPADEVANRSKVHKQGIGFGCLVLLALPLLLSWCAGPSEKDTVAADKSSAASALADASSAASALADAGDAPSSSLTGPQQNAARSAQQYISMSGFSRAGLIDQLSSDAGDGYDVGDATAAVDSLTIDYNEQAARSAKQYLDIGGFSCKGLIEQLSSRAGDKYTVSEARYGAKQAGAC